MFHGLTAQRPLLKSDGLVGVLQARTGRAQRATLAFSSS